MTKPRIIGGGKTAPTLKSNYYKMGAANFLRALLRLKGDGFAAPCILYEHEQ